MMHPRLILAEFRHCLMLGDALPWQVYPLRAGDYAGKPNAISGSCGDVRLYDSVVVGAIGSSRYTRVERTTLSYRPQASQNPTVSGAWTVDAGVTGWDAARIMAQQSVPDDEDATLAALWRW